MNLTSKQREHIQRFVPAYQRYQESDEHVRDCAARSARSELYRQLLSQNEINKMTELEFGQVISSLWASQKWTANMGYFVNKLIHDNSLQNLVDQLNSLVWGQEGIPIRYDTFRQIIKGLGAASLTEILAFVHPNECGLWNDKARRALQILGFEEVFPAVRKSQISGHEYQTFNTLLSGIREELVQNKIDIPDLLGINYYLFEVWRNGKKIGELIPEVDAIPTRSTSDDFDHDEVRDQLVAMGQWLGFQAEKEKLVAKGAKIDAVWQARIANLGVVTYVFEVQRRGSIDSLILNLQRAQNNPSVQRLIVVATSEDIARVRQEIGTLPEGFRRAVSFMETAEVQRAAQLLDELSGIIAKLDLVRSEFGV